MERVILLDMGSFAIKACELELRKNRMTPVWVAQQTLPAESGIDLDAQREIALRELLRSVKVRTKRTVVVVSDPDLVVRPTVVSAANSAEVATALGFAMTEVLPLPLDELVADYEIAPKSGAVAVGETLVLMAGAPERVVTGAIEAVKRAGLRVDRVDVGPLCDVATGYRLLGSTRNCYLVDAGARTTTVMVIDQGVVQLVRTLPIGGEATTIALAEKLLVDHDIAEGYKRALSIGQRGSIPSELVERAEAIVNECTEALVSEIVGSIEYFTLQRGLASVERFVLCGGSAALAGLKELLAERTQLLIECPTPLDILTLFGGSALDNEESPASWITLAGAALRTTKESKGHRRLTLLPSAIRERNEIRKEVGVGLLAIGVVAVGLGVLSFHEVQRTAALSAQVRTASATTAALTTRVAALSRYGTMAQTVSQNEHFVSAALSGAVSWSQVLAQIGQANPSDTWLTQFSATAPSNSAAPSVSFTVGGCSQFSPSQWLTSLQKVSFLGDLWVSTSTLQSATGSSACPAGDTPPQYSAQAGFTTFSATGQFVQAFQSYRASSYLAAIGVKP
ncbi:MAG: pilus assembly protein PilM [Ferrimicrobium sp.]